MDSNLNHNIIPSPSPGCTPISIIKTKRLRPAGKISETSVVIQFFTPNGQEKENNLIPSSHSQKLSPGIFSQKSFHNTGFTPRNLQKNLIDKGVDTINK